MRELILQAALRMAATRPVKYPLVTSEPGSLANNCFEVTFSENPEPHVWTFRFRSMEGSDARGDYFASFGVPGVTRTFTIAELVPQRFRAIHHYRGLRPEFNTPLGFLVATFFHVPFLLRHFNRVAQFLYNRRRLVRRDRIRVLRLFLENTVRKRDYTISEISLLTTLYGKRWYRHSQRDALLAYYALVLDSLVVSKDLDKHHGGYRLSPKGIETLDKYEDDSQRHHDNTRIQWILATLTGLLAFTAVAQIAITIWVEVHPDPIRPPRPAGANQLVYPSLPPELEGSRTESDF
ncbi:hypothetical protein [Mesorhizobium huakuii]|uniref:DUF2207 domain-containing protein n=1 Tax=Mesorhizobium huakuii TaxID=28104 RepID=A0ABZ0VPS8_9HYPH|nr:hypothetical protein [Mesorhizobium huakuii]WQB98666.1 hypothetical protein U0R22_002829 [Mesorhizobium huakuii]